MNEHHHAFRRALGHEQIEGLARVHPVELPKPRTGPKRVAQRLRLVDPLLQKSNSFRHIAGIVERIIPVAIPAQFAGPSCAEVLPPGRCPML